MTPHQTFIVAAIGGLAALLGAALLAGLFLALRALIRCALYAYDDRRFRRHLVTLYRRQLDALPVTDHPKDPR